MATVSKKKGMTGSQRQLFKVLLQAHGTKNVDEITALLNAKRKAQGQKPTKVDSVRSAISSIRSLMRENAGNPDNWEFAFQHEGKSIPLDPKGSGEGRGRRSDAVSVDDFLESLTEDADDLNLDEIAAEIGDETEGENETENAA